MDHIGELLASLQPLRSSGHELIVVDGGSKDETRTIAEPLCDHFITAIQGRASQMNAGAEQASGEILWFLHADSHIAADIIENLPSLVHGAGWGRFDVRLSGERWVFRLIERAMNLRSRITGIATGDQAIFVERTLFRCVGGFPPIRLMEDVALSRKLRRKTRPLTLKQTLTTSSRRWEQQGILYTMLLMWRLRLQYFMGADPSNLANRYYG